TTLHMNRCIVSGNTGTIGGGAQIRNPYYQTTVSTIQNSTFSGNTATSHGGGIGVRSDSTFGANGTLTMANITVADNTATNNGGGLYSTFGNTGAGKGPNSLTIESSTIAGNSAASGGGVFAGAIGNAIVLHNTVVADNSASTANPDTGGIFAANYNFI